MRGEKMNYRIERARLLGGGIVFLIFIAACGPTVYIKPEDRTKPQPISAIAEFCYEGYVYLHYGSHHGGIAPKIVGGEFQICNDYDANK